MSSEQKETQLGSEKFFEKRNRKGIKSQQGQRPQQKPMFLNGIDPIKFISQNPNLVDKQPYLGIYSQPLAKDLVAAEGIYHRHAQTTTPRQRAKKSKKML